MNKLQELDRLRTIAVSKENYDKFKRLGYTADSFNDVLTRLLADVKEDSRK
jgi:predicted CopG family antitoxin